jgi:hypothetical protein
MHLSDIVRDSLAAGQTPDQIARSLMKDQQLPPIPAIKALRAGANMSVGEAKEVVHRNLPVDQRSAAEKLWDDMIELVENLDE